MAEYRIVKHWDGFSVYPVVQPRVIATTCGPDGITQKDVTNDIYRGYTPSTFDAHYRGNDEWWTDIDCGAQRWCGRKTGREIRAAMKTCGFNRETTNQLMQEATTSWGEPVQPSTIGQPSSIWEEDHD